MDGCAGLDNRAILIGHSLGNWIALEFALLCPDKVRALDSPKITFASEKPHTFFINKTPLFKKLKKIFQEERDRLGSKQEFRRQQKTAPGIVSRGGYV